MDARGRPLTGAAAVARAAKRKKGERGVPPIAAFAGFQTRLGKNRISKRIFKYTVVKADDATPKRWRFVRGHDKPTWDLDIDFPDGILHYEAASAAL